MEKLKAGLLGFLAFGLLSYFPWDKLDNAATDGLTGTVHSVAYRIHEMERHFHSYEHWFGAAASPNGEIHVADHMTVTAFQMDAGNDTWGSWLQILGSSDTPHVGTNVYYDFHRIIVNDVETANKLTLIQIGFGASGAAALSADDITELMMTPDKNAKADPFIVQSERLTAGTKVWIRCWVSGQNTSTVDFFFALHEYEG